jgi:hypothetical protein
MLSRVAGWLEPEVAAMVVLQASEGVCEMENGRGSVWSGVQANKMEGVPNGRSVASR